MCPKEVSDHSDIIVWKSRSVVNQTINMDRMIIMLKLNSLTIMQRSQRCEQWNTFRNCNAENVDFRHRLFLYFAAYLIYLVTTFRDNMTGNNPTFSKQTFLWRHFEDLVTNFRGIPSRSNFVYVAKKAENAWLA